MKRLSLLLSLSALLVGCGPSRLPSDFSSGSSSDAGTRGMNDRGHDYDNMAQAIRDGVVPAEAILATIYFDFDRYTVEAKERPKLDAIAPRAKATKIIIAGYTDHFGTDEYNLGLSDRRAQSARDYLVKLGCNQGSTEVMAIGSQQADKSAGGRQSGAKDRKAIIVDANYRGPITSGASKASAPAAGAGKSAPSSAPAPVPTAL